MEEVVGDMKREQGSIAEVERDQQNGEKIATDQHIQDHQGREELLTLKQTSPLLAKLNCG